MGAVQIDYDMQLCELVKLSGVITCSAKSGQLIQAAHVVAVYMHLGQQRLRMLGCSKQTLPCLTLKHKEEKGEWGLPKKLLGSILSGTFLGNCSLAPCV